MITHMTSLTMAFIMLSLIQSANAHGTFFFLPRIKHVIDMLTCAFDCVIHFVLPDTVSVPVCETLHAPHLSRCKYHKKKVVLACYVPRSFIVPREFIRHSPCGFKNSLAPGENHVTHLWFPLVLASFPALISLSAFNFILR